MPKAKTTKPKTTKLVTKALAVKTNKSLAVTIKMPVTAAPDNYFVLSSGVPLKNLKELANSLESMNDDIFFHHVSDSRNDFAAWASEILMEKELAEEMGGIKDRSMMEMKILKHLVNKYL